VRPERRSWLAALLVVSSACPGKIVEPPLPVEVMDAPDASAIASSARGNLRFKGPERLNADFSVALDLRPEAVCTELGLYQCATLVHTVALGGVDPYGTGLYEASGVTAVTTSLIVDRIAWSACTTRVDLDLVSPGNAVVFRGLTMTGAKLMNPEGPEVTTAIGALTHRVLQRDPYSNEVARYMKLAKDIEATGNPEPARAWMQAVCFAVLSSAESVFY
jgi:hypothetical protein